MPAFRFCLVSGFRDKRHGATNRFGRDYSTEMFLLALSDGYLTRRYDVGTKISTSPFTRGQRLIFRHASLICSGSVSPDDLYGFVSLVPQLALCAECPPAETYGGGKIFQLPLKQPCFCLHITAVYVLHEERDRKKPHENREGSDHEKVSDESYLNQPFGLPTETS